MSTESFAALRRNASQDIKDLAEQHLKHDLQNSDREILEKASRQLSLYAGVGSVLGLALGAALAFRVRSQRTRMYAAFKAADKPTHVKFADGRTEPIPDVTPLMKPSTLGDVATYAFFAAGGLFVFGEMGALLGGFSASRTVARDPEAKVRIERAFRGFRADVLRREAMRMESGTGGLGL